MVVNLNSSNFTLVGGSYYSDAFKQDEKDPTFSIGVILNLSGTVSLQSSIDEINWDDVTDSTFVCDTFGLQSFTNGHHLLAYRIKASQVVNSAKILI